MSQYARWPSAGGGSGVATYPTAADLPASASDGALAVTLDTDTLYVFNSGTSTWLALSTPSVTLSIGVIDSNGASSNGATLNLGALIMQSASASYPGLVNTTTQAFAGDKTFADTIFASDGSAGRPSYNFSSDIALDTGMFHPSDGVIAWSTNGGQNMTLTGADLSVAGNITAANFPPTGGANSFAGYDSGGLLTTIPDWTFVVSNGATLVGNQGTYDIPADGTPGVIKIVNNEIEWNAANSNTDQNLNGFVLDSHVDRSHSGQDVNQVVGLSTSASVEGSGTVSGHTAWNLNQNLSGNSGGTTTNALSLGIGAGAGALYNIGTYRGILGGFNAQATSVVGDVFPFNFNTSGDFTGQYQGAFLNHNGNVGGNVLGIFSGVNGTLGGNASMLNVAVNGDITGNYIGANIRHDGASSGYTGVLVTQVGTHTTTNNEGVRVEFGNGTATSKTAFTAVMGDGATSISGRFGEFSWGNGSYDNRIGLNINGGTGNTNTSETGYNLSQSTGTSQSFQGFNMSGAGTTGQWTGINVNGGNCVASSSAVGLNVSMNGITGLPTTNRARALNTDGGVWSQNMGTTTVSNHPFTLDVGNTIGVSLQIISGSPITGTEWAGTTFRNSLQFDDDMGTGPLGLGWAAMLDTPFILGTAGKTVDKASLHGMVPLIAGGTGGTIGELSYVRTFNVVNFGGTTPTINEAYVFKFDAGTGPLSGVATKAHGIYLDDSGLFNYLGGKTRLGGGSYVEPTVTLDVTGAIVVSGDVACATVTPANGATGTFTTADAKTVTVTNGIITSIV